MSSEGGPHGWPHRVRPQSIVSMRWLATEPARIQNDPVLVYNINQSTHIVQNA